MGSRDVALLAGVARPALIRMPVPHSGAGTARFDLSREIKMAIAALSPVAVPRAGSLSKEKELQIRDGVLRVLATTQPALAHAERRREKRHPFPYPVYLTPVGRDGVTPVGETIVVLGKHLSELGFDFYHRDPLPHRRAIVSFEAASGKWIGVLMDLAWCRFGRHGWYDNGGRFLGVVPSPLAEESLPSLME